MLLNNTPSIGILVVTYNRKKLLTELISSLSYINQPINEILIYDNCSDYPISELNFIKEIKFCGNPKINIFRSELNTGGSGGFSNGIKMLYSNNDFVWTMDDDITFSKDSLKILLEEIGEFSVISPAKINKAEKIIDVAGTKVDLNRPFFISHKKDLFYKTKNSSSKGTFKVETFSFEGALFKSSIFKEIDFPVDNYFICHDDLEYSLRIKKNAKIIGLTTKTLCTREFEIDRFSTFSGWKSFYAIRNYFWIHKKYKSSKFWYLRPIFFSIVFIIISLIQGEFKNIKRIIKGIKKGIFQ
jgi:GT2 family glycosyltransferase